MDAGGMVVTTWTRFAGMEDWGGGKRVDPTVLT